MVVHENDKMAISFSESPTCKIQLIEKSRQGGEVVKEWYHHKFDYKQLEANLKEAQQEMNRLSNDNTGIQRFRAKTAHIGG